jgi:hypothetical protein
MMGFLALLGGLILSAIAPRTAAVVFVILVVVLGLRGLAL